MESKRIECEICKQEFKNKNSLSTHILNRHKISKREKQADVSKIEKQEADFTQST